MFPYIVSKFLIKHNFLRTDNTLVYDAFVQYYDSSNKVVLSLI
ncbi:hypothetical protein O3G_MSEX013570 [Manduca sexta]|uniref:Uncharacterized protein n=1 Tax=Manduca sexta TaxID=7130 RepID=A0A921ZSK7_MANSE|nr:hypothetical protein O3G_MSEX013570 [Manduca sexta]